jgi:prepilin-type N-terminal cleavage/methylation domain-containing protein
MSIPKRTKDTRRAFTLVEILIAVAILTFLVVLLSGLASSVNKAWVSGEQRVQTFQDGRAILDLISRELAQAVISTRLQFVQNPSLTPTLASQRTNSSSLFWQAALDSTASGNLSEIGYFLNDSFQLQRFFVPPTDAVNYQVFTNAPNDRSAVWVTSYAGNSAITRTVSDGVVALWIRCLDANDELIPWLSSSTTVNGDTGATPVQFNSAAHFQPAIRGQSSSFKYTNRSTTAQAHLLPATVEITIVTIDAKTMVRSSGSIPGLPALTGPQDIPNAITAFNQQLVSSKVQSARTFTTRVALRNWER